MRRPLSLFAVVILSACQTGSSGLCEAVTCKTGFTCDPKVGICKQTPANGNGGGTAATGGSTASGGGTESAGGSSATGGSSSATGGSTGTGGSSGACSPACSGLLPFCDASGSAPYCVQCLTGFDCNSGESCVQGSCTTAQTGTGGGTTSPVQFDDGGMSAHCLAVSGAATCTTECGRGYICVGGVCQLRGNDGPVQVTLRFNQPEDLDLHVVEPLTDGGTCEIWYGNPNVYFDGGLPFPIMLPFPIPTPASCGAKGWLDLDSNPACQLDNVDVENVIYPANTPAPSGRYIVRVDYYQQCSASNPVPYEVEIRANGQSEFYCGTFDPYSDPNGGNEGSGRTIAGFTVP